MKTSKTWTQRHQTNNKHEYYTALSNQDIKRIKMIQDRINQSSTF